MIGLSVVFVGAAAVVAGLVLLFGPVALVACGALLIVAGILVDWEAVHGKHPAPPSG
jgi:hypothetical protein